jgi:hypothetical protein
LPAFPGCGINRRAHPQGAPGKLLIRLDKYELMNEVDEYGATRP